MKDEQLIFKHDLKKYTLPQIPDAFPFIRYTVDNIYEKDMDK